MSRDERKFQDGAVRLVTRRAGVSLQVRRSTAIQRANQERLLSQIQRDEIRWIE